MKEEGEQKEGSHEEFEPKYDQYHDFKKKDEAWKTEKQKVGRKKFNPVQQMPKLMPEPDYIIKTRPPMWDDWRLNIFRGVKENRLKMEANKIARRKCWETGEALEDCGKAKGMFKIWSCKPEFD